MDEKKILQGSRMRKKKIYGEGVGLGTVRGTVQHRQKEVMIEAPTLNSEDSL